MRIWPQVALILLILPSVGCHGDVGASNRIDRGVEPRYQDRDVRFRTTYYFRIFDICDVLDEDGRLYDYEQVGNIFTKRKKGTYKILNDSLYRFRMTGKASAAFQNVIFESGTLRAEQIDPFGSSIDYDEDTRKFQVRSASENKEINQRNAVYGQVKRLYGLREQAKDHVEATQRIENLILEQLDTLSRGSVSQNVSMAVMAITARESLLGTVQALEDEKVLPGGDEAKQLDTVVSGLKSNVSEDAMMKATGELKAKFNGLIDSYKKVNEIIDRAIEEQERKRKEKLSTKSEAPGGKIKDSLDLAIDNRMAAAVQLQNKQQKLEAAPADAHTEEVKEKELETAQHDLLKAGEDVDTKQVELKKIEDVISKLMAIKAKLKVEIYRLERAAETLGRSPDMVRSPVQPPATLPKSAPTCADGKPSRRGFQVLGPEGFRSFDQDERLVLAMSVDSKPLISTLQQFSDQRFKGQQNEIGNLEAERERVETAQDILSQLGKDIGKPDKTSTSSEILTKVLRAFNQKQKASKPPVGAPDVLKPLGDNLQ